MNSKIKSFLCVLFCFVLLFTISPLQSFAYSNTLAMNFAEPSFDDSSGYFALKYNDKYGVVVTFNCFPVTNEAIEWQALDVTVIINSFTYNSSTGSFVISYNLHSNSYHSFYYQISVLRSHGPCTFGDLLIASESTTSNFTFSSEAFSSDYQPAGIFTKGNVIIDGSTFPDLPVFTPLWAGSDYYNQFQSVIDSLAILHSDNLELIDLYIEAINHLTTLHSDNLDILSKLAEIISGVVQLHSDNELILSDFAKLLKDTTSIKNSLNDVVNYCYDLLDMHLWNLEDYSLTIIDKLDIIIDYLQPDTDVNVSKVDPSNFNEYNKAEQDLINNDGVDVTGAMNVEINQQALTYIWPLVERCLNTNPKVIGLTFTILAVSLVALILGRKGG